MGNSKKITRDEIIKILEDKKAVDIQSYDLQENKTKLSDFCIIASGTSSRHAEGLVDIVRKFLNTTKRQKVHVEGRAQSGWMLLESCGIEVHIFKPELREYYDIDEIMKAL